MIKVVVVDDHPVVRGGVVGWLDAQPDLSVVAYQEVPGDLLLEPAALIKPEDLT